MALARAPGCPPRHASVPSENRAMRIVEAEALDDRMTIAERTHRMAHAQ